MISLNEWISEKLLEGGVACPACEEPVTDDADPGHYITWRRTAERSLYASGAPWLNEYDVAMTLWSPLYGEAAADTDADFLQQVCDALTRSQDLWPRIRAFVSLTKINGTYLPEVGRRAYGLQVTIREELP